MDTDKYFIVKEKAIPSVLLKVVEAKRLLASERVMTVQDATEKVDISRSSFYKYRDDIFPFHEHNRGRTVTFMLQMDDIQGLLSIVLKKVAEGKANILTIHQTVPINGIAILTLSIEVSHQASGTAGILGAIEKLEGIHYVKMISRE